jgi:hypothetical protein
LASLDVVPSQGGLSRAPVRNLAESLVQWLADRVCQALLFWIIEHAD